MIEEHIIALTNLHANNTTVLYLVKKAEVDQRTEINKMFTHDKTNIVFFSGRGNQKVLFISL
jgi:hypothetical protein